MMSNTATMSNTVTTGVVRLSYCNIFTPRREDDGKEKYGTAILIPMSDTATVKAINDAIEAAKVAGAGKLGAVNGVVPKVKTPLRNGNEEKPGDSTYKDMWFLNANAYKQPGIVDQNRQQILDPNKVYSGCWARVNITMYAFNVGTNKGIAAGLNHVQFIKDDAALDGRVNVDDAFSDDFDDSDMGGLV